MTFKPGQSGNPQGLRRAKLFADALRMELAAVGADHKALRKIARNLIDMAMAGEMVAIKELADRLDGKAAQALQHSGEDAGPIVVMISSADAKL